MPERVLLAGGRLIDPASGRDERADVLIAGDEIESVGVSLPADGASRVPCDGLVIAPGFVDLHCHLREPGGEDRETIESGTRAAVLGGFTAVAAMANTDPVADCAAVVQEVAAAARERGLCDVFPVGAITRGLAGSELVDLGEMASLGVRMFSDDGRCVPDARTLRMALEYAKPLGVVVADHCEEVSLSEGWQMHEGHMSSLLGLWGAPAEAEEIAVARDLLVARLTGGRLHCCHLSAAGSVEQVRRAKQEGIRVTAEVTPHHLTFTEEDYLEYDTNLKVNPPMRSKADREALLAGLADGTIDAVATDHAPHASQDKETEYARALPGTIGLETAFAAVMTAAVVSGRMPLPRLVEAMSTAPARILGANDHGGPIASGRPANLVVFDPDSVWTVGSPFASRSTNSAFLGRTLTGKVVHTIVRGAFVVRDGEARR